jgi:hypothetical protein
MCKQKEAYRWVTNETEDDDDDDDDDDDNKYIQDQPLI